MNTSPSPTSGKWMSPAGQPGGVRCSFFQEHEWWQELTGATGRSC